MNCIARWKIGNIFAFSPATLSFHSPGRIFTRVLQAGFPFLVSFEIPRIGGSPFVCVEQMAVEFSRQK